MEIMESIRAALKELIVPELDKIKEGNREIRAILEVTNKRLDDVNTHLADQSRRIDSLRKELVQRIDSLREELVQRIGSVARKTERRY
jgi:molybdopterin converting factor small subunit